MLGYFSGKAYGRQCLVKQSWEMGEICPKTKSYPPLIKQKLISTPPHIMMILRLTPPPLKRSPPIGSLITSLLGGFLPPVHTSESLDSELVSSSHELGDSSSSTASLALRFPRAWVRTQEFLSDWAFFFEAQFNHTVFYLPYFKFVLLLKFQQLGFSFC